MDRKNTSKIEIKTDGLLTYVKIDGQEVKGIRRLDFSVDANSEDRIPTLRLDMIATDMTVDGFMLPELPDIYKPFYRRSPYQESDS